MVRQIAGDAGAAEVAARSAPARSPLLPLFAGALALRVLLLPFIHPWDGNTFHNLFAQLARDENPYLTFWSLTLEARSRLGIGYANWYEYFAYPPLLLYLYYPLAKLVALVAPLSTAFYLPGTEGALPNRFPLAFLLAYKAPIWAADLGIGYLLYRRTGKVWPAALYLFNPLVLVVSGAWMFDSIPAFFALAALLAYEKDRVALAGFLLALGALAKFFPLFLVPTFFLLLVWRRDARAFLLVGVFALTAVLLTAPFYPEVLAAFQFNGGREGGGLTLYQVPQTYLKLHGESLLAYQTLTSPLLGTLVLVGGMAATYALLDRARPSAPRAVLVTLLGFLLFTKLVNEQYVVWVLPFLLLVLAEARAGAGAPSWAPRAATHVLWVVPFLYLLVHVPVTAFWPGGLAATEWLVRQRVFMLWAAAVAAVAFVASVLFALWAFWPRRDAGAHPEEARA